METRIETRSQEAFAAEEAVKNESPIQARDFLAELEPLLPDYFVGPFVRDEENIIYSLPNGQKFRLTAEEIT